MGAGRKELREFWGDCGGVGGDFSRGAGGYFLVEGKSGGECV